MIIMLLSFVYKEDAYFDILIHQMIWIVTELSSEKVP